MDLKQFAQAVYNFMNAYHMYAFNQLELAYYAEELEKEIKSGKKRICRIGRA